MYKHKVFWPAWQKHVVFLMFSILFTNKIVSFQTATFTQCATTIPASEYTDTFGLLLLSRYRLRNIKTVDYHPGDSLLIPRGYISAKVQTSLPAGHVCHQGCIH